MTRVSCADVVKIVPLELTAAQDLISARDFCILLRSCIDYVQSSFARANCWLVNWRLVGLSALPVVMTKLKESSPGLPLKGDELPVARRQSHIDGEPNQTSPEPSHAMIEAVGLRAI